MESSIDDIEMNECTEIRSQENVSTKIVWSNLHIYVKIPGSGLFKKEKPFVKRIINDCTGSVKKGTLLALMGARFVPFFHVQLNVLVESIRFRFQWRRKEYSDGCSGLSKHRWVTHPIERGWCVEKIVWFIQFVTSWDSRQGRYSCWWAAGWSIHASQKRFRPSGRSIQRSSDCPRAHHVHGTAFGMPLAAVAIYVLVSFSCRPAWGWTEESIEQREPAW